MPQIPRTASLDSTLALMRDPYRFIAKRCRRHGADVFRTRILLRETICMSGPAAAELFYDNARFARHGAAPARLQKTLLGEGGVQGLDGAAHQHRKAMFLSLMTPERLAALAEMTADGWHTFARRWASQRDVVLYEEIQELLTRAVCAWAGVPLAEAEVGRRRRELTALFDAAGAVGLRHWWSRFARVRAERWIADVVDGIRGGQLRPPEGSAAHVIAWHRQGDGQLLDARIAAVDLLNVLRPTVAVSVYFLFVAHALHRRPESRQRLRAGESGYAELFVQEVRRFYPFFPSVVARTREAFEWNGYPFPPGRRVMLDLHGTNHDPRAWDTPEDFRPERFRRWDGSPFNFIPQGGGDHLVHHRCAGEWITIELMKVAANFLAGGMDYEVPPQDLRIDYGRLPALPQSRFVIRSVRPRG